MTNKGQHISADVNNVHNSDIPVSLPEVMLTIASVKNILNRFKKLVMIYLIGYP